MLRACVIDFEGSWDVHLPWLNSPTTTTTILVECSRLKNFTEEVSLNIFYGQNQDRLKAARDPLENMPKNVGTLEFIPFESAKRIGPVAYRLRLPQELNSVHDTFHVSNLKKYLADPTLHVPLEEIQVDAKLNFVKEPVEILEREIKKLKRSRIPIIKMIDYALWEVIENGATLPKIVVMEGVEKVMPITSAEDKAQRRLEVKAKSNLMMVIPNEHQLKFNSIKDAKKLLEAVEKRFAELETMSMDDIYNNLKVYELEVKGMFSSSLSTHNMDFVSSSNNNISSSNEAVNAAHGVTTASTQVNTAYFTNINNLSDVVICSFFASQPNSPQLAHEE
ncbi:hypothetical protein Tco_0827622 [Tanacetum coccineum]